MTAKASEQHISQIERLNKKDRCGPDGDQFSVGLWLKLHGSDLITLTLVGLLGIGLYDLPPAPNRSFPVYSDSGGIVYPEFAYPFRREIVPIWLAAFLSFAIPFSFICLFQLRLKSLNHLLTTTTGLIKSLITAAVFQVFLKFLIGGLRPHFYEACQPDVNPEDTPHGNGFGKLMYDRSVCKGDPKDINDSLESFPSGHSTAAFAGFIFLSLYFNAQLKVMSGHNPAYWKMILFFAPILGATLIAGALTIDEFHNWYDVVFGAIIGTSTAIVAFRQTFASLFDYRFNHLLLPRTVSMFQDTPIYRVHSSTLTNLSEEQRVEGEHGPVTREEGWGWSPEAAAANDPQKEDEGSVEGAVNGVTLEPSEPDLKKNP